MMDAGLFSAGAVLVGAAIGGSMSFLGSWIGQQREVHAQWVGQDRLRRQELYKEFIQQASKCYADALQHQTPDVPALVVLYGKISRIRAISSPKVLAAAEQVLRRIADIYFEPPIVLSRDQIGRCFGMDRSISFETLVKLVEPNSRCSAPNSFQSFNLRRTSGFSSRATRSQAV